MRYHLVGNKWAENPADHIVVPDVNESSHCDDLTARVHIGVGSAKLYAREHIAPCIDISEEGGITYVKVIIDVGGKRWCKHTMLDTIAATRCGADLLDKDRLLEDAERSFAETQGAWNKAMGKDSGK